MLQALDHFDGHCGLAPVCQCLYCIREPRTSPGTPGCPRGAEQRETINSFNLLAALLVTQPSPQLFLNCRLLKPAELVCCGGLWGAGAARRGVLCLSLALGTRWDGAEHIVQHSSSVPALPQGFLCKWGWVWNWELWVFPQLWERLDGGGCKKWTQVVFPPRPSSSDTCGTSKAWQCDINEVMLLRGGREEKEAKARCGIGPHPS